MTRTLEQKLLAGTDGNPTATAATTILTQAVGGRLLDALILAWDGDTIAEIDWPASRQTTGCLSGGERRLFTLADSLATGYPTDLADTLTGLDEGNARTVLLALSHALGVRILGGGLR